MKQPFNYKPKKELPKTSPLDYAITGYIFAFDQKSSLLMEHSAKKIYELTEKATYHNALERFVQVASRKNSDVLEIMRFPLFCNAAKGNHILDLYVTTGTLLGNDKPLNKLCADKLISEADDFTKLNSLYDAAKRIGDVETQDKVHEIKVLKYTSTFEKRSFTQIADVYEDIIKCLTGKLNNAHLERLYVDSRIISMVENKLISVAKKSLVKYNITQLVMLAEKANEMGIPGLYKKISNDKKLISLYS